jgi:hypothetical protein
MWKKRFHKSRTEYDANGRSDYKILLLFGAEAVVNLRAVIAE